MKSNWAVDQAVGDAVGLAVSRAVYELVYLAVLWAAFWAVDDAAYRVVDQAVSGAVYNDPAHPTLPDFLVRSGADAL